MKTIEVKSGNNIAQFTTKSVTVEGREYFYSNMTDIVNEPGRPAYHFTYEGRMYLLPYEEKDSKILSAIFGQVQGLQHQPPQTADAQTTSQEPRPPQATGEQRVLQATETPPASQTAETQQTPDTTESQAESETKQPQSETQAKPVKAEAKSDKAKEKAERKAEKEAEKAKRKAEKAEKKASGTSKKKAPEKSEKKPMDEEKKARLKKSLILFGLIVIIIAAVSVIYGFIFGTSSAPSSLGPNSNESQQYDEIDDLINDLQ
ncbi:MAG: hypothetical protein GX663_07140 [Clostridiales bacterium]|nr:hypothetical protein [Clostridiales bacterium]